MPLLIVNYLNEEGVLASGVITWDILSGIAPNETTMAEKQRNEVGNVDLQH